jgi:phosphoribosylformylglycinamidine cyclo-ligase
VVLQRKAWSRDPIFGWLQQHGGIEQNEMYRTFNCGIGMVVIVPPDQTDAALKLLNSRGETATVIGEVRKGGSGVVIEE